MGVHLMPSHGWRTLAASVAGTSHLAADQPCADASAARVLSGRGGVDILVTVAADGAGCAVHSAEGARIACARVLEKAEAWARVNGTLAGFARVDAGIWVEDVRERLAERALETGEDIREYATTLLVTLVDRRQAVFFQVGDGAIVFRDRDGGYRPALWPQNGQYANSTWFVTDDDPAAIVQMERVRGVHEVALLTDGLQSLALRFVSREAHGPFFAPMFERLRQEGETASEGLAGELEDFLDCEAVIARTDDDKTLVLATRVPVGG